MTERRKFPRYPLSCRATWFNREAQQHQSCRLVEISHEGMAVVLPNTNNIRINAPLSLSIEAPRQKESFLSEIAVCWTRALETAGEVLLGGRITAMDIENKGMLLEHAFDNRNRSLDDEYTAELAALKQDFTLPEG
ncbi:MAG: PilZ domain-containing protein [Deltaproteobacteria bacterium]|nr:PilZ domain-containing protein [Deltaproteobacteria bacterium]